MTIEVFNVVGRCVHILIGDSWSLVECLNIKKYVCDGEHCRLGSQANGDGSQLRQSQGNWMIK